eukprot:12805881-Alexandrium_andersonii.AAC.1
MTAQSTPNCKHCMYRPRSAPAPCGRARDVRSRQACKAVGKGGRLQKWRADGQPLAARRRPAGPGTIHSTQRGSG